MKCKTTPIVCFMKLLDGLVPWIAFNLSGLRLGDTGLETVLESSRNVLQVSHSTGTSGSSSLSLQSPVVGS